MGSTTTRQVTLLETWRNGKATTSAVPVPTLPTINNTTSSIDNNTMSRSDSRGRGGRGRGQSSRRGVHQPVGRGGRGRGRGRGRGSKVLKCANSSFFEDDEDEICHQAMGQFELDTSDVAKALEAANTATDLPGFDTTAGSIWIYPTNKSVRDYQFQIVQTALFNNTMVSLPTGLGKTFIAAVVMYNFHRWYPNDLIIFMAPTRPLVTQQLEACHHIVGIHPSKTIELTGQTSPKKREELWKTKSVFFLTPQVMTSDLTRGFCPADKVRCVVVDEAHKALGQHAYAQVIAMLSERKALFRVLALSATPGSDLAAVQQVFKNLLISRVELRSEASPDILPYIHDKQVDKVVVQLDEYLKSVYDNVIEVYQVFTGKLMKQNVLNGRDGSSFTSYQLLKARELFREKMAHKFPNYLKGYIEVDFATCISLAHSVDLLLNHGLRSFYAFLQGVFNKEKGNAAVTAQLKKNTSLQDVLKDIQEKLSISVANSTFNMNSSSLLTSFSRNANTSNTSNLTDDENENPPDYLLSHPKMRALKDIILIHFKGFETKNETTRVMIFSQYRDSVQEIGNMLSTLGPLVKPMVFIGQANNSAGKRGLKQKDQVQVVQSFRDGGYNVLISTSVGEEGLDIGEVDLIICFDASKSPTRLVQRMGRTGRQRNGRIIFLLTKGREERSYSASFSLQNSISKNITDPSKLLPYLYKFSPRMVPQDIDPQCFKMSIVLTSEQKQDEQDEDVIIIDDIDDDLKEKTLAKSKPAKTVGRQKKASSTTTAKLKKKPNNRPGIARSTTSTNSNNCSERTITQCFDDLLQKTNHPKIITSQSISLVAEKNIAEEISNKDQSVILEENDLMDGMAGDYGDHDLLYEIFDVVNLAVATAKSCLDIPKLPKPIKWLSEFNNIDKDSILIKGFDLDCLKERLDSYQMVTSFRDKCRCGNIDNSPCDMIMEASNLEKEDNVWTKQNHVSSVTSVINDDVKTIKNRQVGMSSTSKELACKQEFEMDEGFMFDENDPFFDDDWEGDEDEIDSDDKGKLNSVNVVPDKKLLNFGSRTLEDVSPIPLFDDSFEELPFDEIENMNVNNSVDSSTTSNDEFGTPVKKHPLPNIINIGFSNPTFSSQLPSYSCGGTTSKAGGIVSIPDDSSTTSNDEEFISPKKIDDIKSEQPKSDYIKSEEPKFTQKKESQVNPDLFKDDFLLFEEYDEFEEEMLQMATASKASPRNNSEDLFEINEIDSCSLLTSTPVKECRIEHLARDVFTPPPLQDSPRSITSDLSPDLSQFRFQNRMKRIKLDEPDNFELSERFSQIMDPNNKSAEILNKYVDELRRKNQAEALNRVSAVVSNPTSIVNVGFTPPPVQQFPMSTAISAENLVSSTNSAKKKFKFKKKSAPESQSNTTTLQSPKLSCYSAKQPVSSKVTETSIRNSPEIQIVNIVNKITKKLNSSDEKNVSTKENILPTSPKLNLPSSNANNRNKIDGRKGFNSSSSSSVWRPPAPLADDWIDMEEQNKSKKPIFRFKARVNTSIATADKEKAPTEQVTGSLNNSSFTDIRFQTSHSKLSRGVVGRVKKTVETTIPEKLTSGLDRHSFKAPSNSNMTEKINETLRSQTQKNTQSAFKMPLPPRISTELISDDDFDDDFIAPLKRGTPITPKSNPRIFRQNVPSLSSDSFLFTQESIASTFMSSANQTHTRQRRKKRRLNGNPFIDLEADVDNDDSGSSMDEDDEFDQLDNFDDSFVDHENEETISDSQQIRYMRSVKDIEPVQVRRVEVPVSPLADPSQILDDIDERDYDSDSFCVPNDDVEFQDIGVFTQAMNVAREEVMMENPQSAKKRKTRRQVRQAAVAREEAREAQLLASSNPNINSNKRRRRIIFQNDSSDEN